MSWASLKLYWLRVMLLSSQYALLLRRCFWSRGCCWWRGWSSLLWNRRWSCHRNIPSWQIQWKQYGNKFEERSWSGGKKLILPQQLWSLIYTLHLLPDNRYLSLRHHSWWWSQQSCTLLRHYRMYSDVIIFYCARFNKVVRLLLLTLTTTHPRLSVFRIELKSKRCVTGINMYLSWRHHAHF